MKEIDFIPEWYKNKKRQQMGYRAQYVVVGVIILSIAVWNFITQSAVSKAKATLAVSQCNNTAIAGVTEEFSKIKSQIAELQKKKNILKEINSKITVSNVLAEIGFVTTENIVLNEISLKAEKVSQENRGSGDVSGDNKNMFLGDVKFKISVNGVALNPGDVANLICDLENSPYFCGVIPAYSRNRFVMPESALGQKHSYVTEFSLDCYIENYKETIVTNK